MNKEQFLAFLPQNEDQFSATVNTFINHNYPNWRKFYFHIPNESATNAKIRSKLVSMGLLAGVPDYCFLKPNTWFIELKMPYNTLSPKQKVLHEIWAKNNIEIYICKTTFEVYSVIEKKYS